MTKKQQNIVYIISLVLILLLTLIPIMKIQYFFKVDDFSFHYGRMENYYEAVRRGNLFPKVFPLSAGGSGYGVDIFYPSLPLLPYALLRLFVTSITAYKGYLFFIYLATWVSSLIFAQQMFSTMKARLFFVLCYVLNPYLFINIFLRGAVGEAMALAVLPICFLGTWEIFKGNQKRWWILSIGMSLLLMCHLISSLLYGLFLAILFMTYLFSKKEFTYFIALAKAAGLSFLLSFWQLIPVIEQNQAQKFTAFLKTFHPDLSPSILDLFKNSFRLNFALHKATTYSFILFPYLIMMLLFFVLRKKDSFHVRIIIITFVFFIMTAEPFSSIVFGKTPLKMIQFSYRFTGLISLVFLFVIVSTIEKRTKTIPELGNIIMLVLSSVLLLMTFISDYQFKPEGLSEKSVVNNNKNLQILGGGFEYIKAYESPAQHNKGLQITNYLNKDRKGITIVDLNRDYDTTTLTIDAKNYELFETDLNFYKGYVASVKERKLKTTPVIEVRGRVAFVVKPGINKVTIKYKKTIIQHLSFLISLIGWLGLLGGVILKKVYFKKDKFTHMKANF